MPQDAPRGEWIPSRDYLARWPLIESWPGLRAEIKRTWEALAKAATSASVVATRGEWEHFLGVSPSSLMRRLCTLQRIGLIRVTAGGDGNQRLTLELIDPLTIERRPVGVAAALRVRRPRPGPGRGCFERQTGLFSDSPPGLRIATPEEDDPDESAQPVSDVASQAKPVVGPHPKPLSDVTDPPNARQWAPTAGAPAPAPVRSDLNDLNEMNDLMMSKGGEGEVERRGSRVEGQNPTSGSGRSTLDSGPPPPIDPVEALTSEDFERRREEITERANGIACRLWRVDQRARMSADDKSLLLKVCFLAASKPCPPYGWTWLDDTVDRVSRSKSRTVLRHPAGYLHQTLRKKVTAAGRNFPNDLAVLQSILSPDLFSAPAPAAKTPPARASPEPQDEAALPWARPADEAPYIPGSLLAAQKAAIAGALAAKESSNPQSPKEPP